MKKTSKIAIIVVIVGILLLGIGYAAISNIILNIGGTVTADPSQANFNVRFTEVKEVSDTAKVTAGITDDLNATIDVQGLKTLGETVTATYEIENASENLSANLTIETTNSNTEYFEIESMLAETSLLAKTKTTVTVTVKLIKEPIEESAEATVNVIITANPVQPGEEPNIPGEVQKTLSSLTNENIGEYIDLGNDIVDYNGTTDVTTDDWRILYVDEENEKVYAILSSYLPNTYLSSIEGINVSDIYSVTGISNSDLVNILKNEGYYVLDYWENLANGISGAKVTGTPTAELLLKGYNADNGTNLNYEKYPNLVTSCTTGDYNLYVPHYSSNYEGYEMCYGYWLANEAGELNVWDVYLDGSVTIETYDMGGYSTRPVVSLPFSTEVTKTNGVWEVTNHR